MNPPPDTVSSNVTATSAASSATHTGKLAHFPIALFSSVMGLAGLALAWFKAHHLAGAPVEIGVAVRWLATLTYVALAALFVAKAVRHPATLAADWRHPVRLNFFPAISIGLVLLGTAWAEAGTGTVARGLWMAGAVLHLVFTVSAMSSWIHHTHYDVKHINPAWFIPVVGNILVPIAGVRFAPAEVSWFFFSIGVVFWLVLMTIVMYRLFFHEPLVARLTPTLFILLAPPSVGFISYLALTDELDAFARILYYTALFLALVLAANALRFFRLPFFISAWAYSFPLAAMTIATFAMAARTGLVFFQGLALVLLAVLTVVVAVLVFRTVLAAVRGQICVPD
ncbi:MAG: SLAC1 anion channel family protein [Rhodocyclaceae bacterium]